MWSPLSGEGGDYEVRYVTSYTHVYQPSDDLAAIGLCPHTAAAGCSEGSVVCYQTVRRHIPEDSSI
jgi:hypothetical protein